MRGTPLIRTLLLLLALIGTGAWIMRITSRGPKSAPPVPPHAVEPAVPGSGIAIPYRLLLSADAASVEITTLDAAAGEVSSTFQGTLRSRSADPVIALKVRWSGAAGEHRFAKLTLEIPGRETLERVFDASGDIDDLWELPAPTDRP